MLIKIKKLVFIAILFIILFKVNVYAATQARLVVNDELIPKSLSTYIIDNTNYINQDILKKRLGFSVWNNDQLDIIYISKNENLITISRTNKVKFNWKPLNTYPCPQIINDKIYVPLNIVQVLYKYPIVWNIDYKFLRIATNYESNYKLEEEKIIEKYREKLIDSLQEKGIFPNIDGIYPPEYPNKFAYLTFDDGPSLTVTPIVLNILKQYNIKATFFMLGSSVENYPQIVKRVSNESHIIGNHTYSHKSQVYSSLDRFKSEIIKTNKLVYDITGNYPKLFRPPYGNKLSSSYKSFLKKEGLKTYIWNIDSGDSKGTNIPSSRIYKNVSNSLWGNRDIVIILHDSQGHFQSAKALKPIIKILWKKGYGIKPLTSETVLKAKVEMK